METVRIPLEDWEGAALQELARARGVDPTTLARRLLGETIRVQCEILCDPQILHPVRPSEARDDLIENRLLGLFDE